MRKNWQGKLGNGQMIHPQSMDEGPLIDKVEDSPSDKSPQPLGPPVGKYLAPGMPSGCSQRQSYGRIDMSATDSSSDVDTKHNGKSPPKNDNNPIVRKWSRGVTCAYVSKEENGRYAAITEENQDHCAKELSDHFTERAGQWRRSSYSLTCHRYSLLFCGEDMTTNSEVCRLKSIITRKHTTSPARAH